MNGVRRFLYLGSAIALALAGTVFVGTANAAHVPCGATIMVSTVLDSDVGPCPSGGIIIGASSVVLDLNGHRVFGTPQPGDGAGILLRGRSGVTVRNGTVSNFDAGVAIEGGTANTVTGISARDNIGRQTELIQTQYGDGIAIESSTNNRIEGNEAVNNGPYSGIGLYSVIDADHPREHTGTSSGNVIRGNRVHSNVVGRDGSTSSTDNDGIRVEPFTTGNTIIANSVWHNGLDGISLFNGAADNVIRGNDVFGNGFFRSTGRRGDGIIVFNRADRNVIENNRVHGNADNGIRIRGPFRTNPGSVNNVIRFNVAFNNSRRPTLPHAVFGNETFDLHDQNPDCDNNLWFGNRYETAFPPCTTVSGQQISVP